MQSNQGQQGAEVEVHVDEGGVGTLTLCNKTMAPRFFAELEANLDRLEGDEGLRALVIRGAEAKVFSYGLDLPKAFSEWGEMLRGSATAGPRHKLRTLIRGLQRAMEKLLHLRVPTICAIHGPCIGGGLDLAAACDMRLASREAVISLRETRLAIVADLGSLQLLPGIIGQGRTRELAFTGRDVTADEALAMGLVNSVHATPEELFAAARALAQKIAANAPRTVEGVKVALNRQVARGTADGLEHVATWNSAFLASEDLGEAMAAYAGRRAPEFKGR